MKKFNDFKKRLSYAFFTGVAMCLPSITKMSVAAGQSSIGSEVLDSASDELTGLLTSLVRLLQIVMGLGALVVLAMVIFKIFKGDREAAEKLAWWVAGLALGFVLISVVAGIVRGSAQSAAI